MPAAEVADRFGYSTASVHQMATLLRGGKLSLFTDPRPGPEGAAQGHRRAAGPGAGAARRRAQRHRDRRRAHRRGPAGVRADRLADPGRRGHRPAAPPRRGPPRPAGPAGPGQGRPAARLAGRRYGAAAAITPGCCCCSRPWPSWACPTWSARPAIPSTRALSAWQSVGTLLLAKCARKARVHHVGSLTDDEGLAFTLGLTALPKATHLGTYSWRVRRDSNRKLLSGLVAGAAPARAGHRRGRVQLRLPRHPPPRRRRGQLEKHYVPRRSQRTRAVLTFFAQDHASSRDGLRQRRHHQGRAGRRDHRLRRLLAATPPDQTPACWSSTPS